MKKLIWVMTVLTGFAVFSPIVAHASVFNSAISNPFLFCKAPKPCKICHPWRAIYEEICVNQGEASTTEDPDPVQAGPTVPVKQPWTGTKAELVAEIDRLRVLWQIQGINSKAAYEVVEQCVAIYGRVQDGYCKREMELFEAAAIPTRATRDEIYRLEDLLAAMG